MIFLRCFVALLLVLVPAQGFKFEEIKTADKLAQVSGLLDRCKFGGKRDFLDDPKSAAPIYAVRMATSPLISDEATFRKLTTAINGDISASTFWPKFSKRVQGFKTLGKDSFVLQTSVTDNKRFEATYTDYAFDADNLCTRMNLRSKLLDSNPPIVIESHVSVVSVKEEGSFYTYMSEHECHVNDPEVLTTEQKKLASKFCGIIWQRNTLEDSEIGAFCMPLFIRDGGAGLDKCLQEARKDAAKI